MNDLANDIVVSKRTLWFLHGWCSLSRATGKIYQNIVLRFIGKAIIISIRFLVDYFQAYFANHVNGSSNNNCSRFSYFVFLNMFMFMLKHLRQLQQVCSVCQHVNIIYWQYFIFISVRIYKLCDLLDLSNT